jgi:CheY-like chemotaxis protein
LFGISFPPLTLRCNKTVQRRLYMLVLIVDDHPLLRHAIKEVIESHFSSSDVRQASTGEEALRIVKAERVELAVLDIALPDYSGLTVLKRIKQLRPSVKCLMLSMQMSLTMRGLRWYMELPVISPKGRRPRSCMMPCEPFCPGVKQ